MKTPKISIIIITWNSAKKLTKCLRYIENQNYPKTCLEIIVVDGGSKDDTFNVTLAFKKNNFDIILIKTNIVDPEPKRAMGVLKAKGTYICHIDPDNYILDKNWLQNMIDPLERDKSLTGSQTLRYAYDKKESLINRYFALFGFNDPVVYYLKKADRIPYFENTWLFNKEYLDKGNYFEVTLEKDIPTMGCNGVVFRRAHYLKTGIEQSNFFHIDIIQDLVNLGFQKYAIVKNDILHSTGSTFIDSIMKRIRYMNIHYYQKSGKRRYFVYDPHSKNDKKNLILFVIYTLTIVQPVYLSIRGFIIIHDIAWFLHFPMCVGFLFAYSAASLNKLRFKI